MGRIKAMGTATAVTTLLLVDGGEATVEQNGWASPGKAHPECSTSRRFAPGYGPVLPDLSP